MCIRDRINTALKGEFLRHQIADTGTQLVICEADYLPRILPLAEQLSEVSQILYRGERAEPASCRIPIAALDEFRGEDDTPFTSKPQPSDLACLIYTSGTTGPSKGCMTVSYTHLSASRSHE